MSINLKLCLWSLLAFTTGCDRTIAPNNTADTKKTKKNCLSLVGGTKTQAYPGSAIIGYRNSSNGITTCSATFVGHNTLFTASHCLNKINPVGIRYLGYTDLPLTQMEARLNEGITAIKVFHHGDPYFGSSMDMNNDAVRMKDFAIVIFPDKTAPEVFPVAMQKPAEGVTVRLIGYGRTSRSSKVTEDRIQRTGTNTLENFVSRGSQMLAVTADPNMTSATDVLTSQGDSGGGMFYNNQLVGVLSSSGSLTPTLGFSFYTDISTDENRDLIARAKAQGADIGPLTNAKLPNEPDLKQDEKNGTSQSVDESKPDTTADSSEVEEEDPSEDIMIDKAGANRKVKKDKDDEECNDLEQN